jgi:3'(2'), 5'-bisphosphate nucleotidase
VSLAPSASLLDAIIALSRVAGDRILEIYGSDFAVTHKVDESPLTQADLAAHKAIVAGLATLTPDIPVLSEEGANTPYATRSSWSQYWLVDPLDGTKEFIKKNGEFTVNIALIDKGRPVLGIVLAPDSDTLWRGIVGKGADKSEKNGAFGAIATRKPPPEGLTAFASRSTAIYSDLDIWFRNNGLTVAERKQAGSSLKFCLIAEGKADIYPRFGPTNEWDTAAGQGVLEAAGGEVVTTDGRPLTYGKANFSNPHFIAHSKDAR